MIIKLYKMYYYGSENVVSSSNKHCVIFMKMNIFSLFFLIGQTTFLTASNIKNAESFIGLYIQAKFIDIKYSDLDPAEKLGALLLT